MFPAKNQCIMRKELRQAARKRWGTDWWKVPLLIKRARLMLIENELSHRVGHQVNVFDGLDHFTV